MDAKNIKVLEVRTLLADYGVEIMRWAKQETVTPDPTPERLLDYYSNKIYEKLEEGAVDV